MIYELGAAYMRSAQSLGSFLSLQCCLWNSSNVRLTVDGPLSILSSGTSKPHAKKLGEISSAEGCVGMGGGGGGGGAWVDVVDGKTAGVGKTITDTWWYRQKCLWVTAGEATMLRWRDNSSVNNPYKFIPRPSRGHPVLSWVMLIIITQQQT